jgi:hypothetical protein
LFNFQHVPLSRVIASVQAAKLVSVCVLFVATAITIMPAHGAEVSAADYNPKLCHEDAHGRQYVAMGLAVVGIDADLSRFEKIEVSPWSRLTPPDPKDEYGCPGNPRQYWTFPAAQTVLPNMGQIATDLHLRITTFILGPIHGSGTQVFDGKPLIPPPGDTTWRENLSIPNINCHDKNAIIRSADGITTCTSTALRNDPDPSIAFIFSKEKYKTPFGDTFWAFCPPAPTRWVLSPCSVSNYAVPSGIGVAYQFVPTTHTSDPALASEIVAFDKQLRASLTALTIAHYPWAFDDEQKKIMERSK